MAADVPDRPVAMVMRDRFDIHLLRHVRADIRDGSPVVTLRQDKGGVEVAVDSGETCRARYLIGADGANSRVARLVGLRRDKWMGGAIEVEVPADDGLLAEYADTALFIFGTPPKGYLWIFPKAEHLSVGIGAFREKVPHMRQILCREMARLGIQLDGVRHHGHPLPIHLKREPLHRDRVLLVGDAAGLMDPLLGEGIRHAIDSGQLAAESVLAGDPQRYSRRVHRRIGSDLLWGLRWARLFYDYPWESFELAIRNPRFLDEFLHRFAEKTTYWKMAARAIPNVLLGLGQRRPVSRPGDRTQR